jgi:hypothetical protein
MRILFVVALVIAGYSFMPKGSVSGIPGVSTTPVDTSISKIAGITSGISFFNVNTAFHSREPLSGIAGYSSEGRPIEAFYFPGTSDKRALVIGGVHGSELSAIEVARELLTKLPEDEQIYYSVIVIPCLFPDNANTARTNPSQIGSVFNIGRYSHKEAADPNRQMPALGKAFHKKNPVDFAGRLIEPENQLLLDFIQEFRPHRIVNLHAIRITEQGGVYADPRTDSRGLAFDYTSDSSLAVDMARYIEINGGVVPGNKLNKKPAALYHADPPAARPGEKQKRNLQGSKLPNKRGYGVSLGSWASTAVDDSDNAVYNRPAIRLITMEFTGYKRPADYDQPAVQQHYRKQVELYAEAIREVFLARNYEE